MQNQKDKPGKLIIIEGIDGSGKATQTKRLVERLQLESYPVESFAFPRHGEKFFGLLVDRCLNNEFGEAAKLDPHLASLVYACDRWEAKDKINAWLTSGKIVVLDRYATSNMGHQASKISDLEEKDKFLDWLNEMEFETFKIPKPDLCIYLNVDVDVVQKLMQTREHKSYINGQHDGLEKDVEHLKTASATYNYICGKYNDYWQKVECVEQGQLLDIDQIHDQIWRVVLGLLS